MTSLVDAASIYLEGIDATGLFRERVARFVSIYDSLYPDGTFTDILICETLDEEEGTRAWTSLWLYGSTYAAECKNFLFTDTWDLARVAPIRHWSMESSNYTPTAISDQSRMGLTWSDTNNIIGRMTATGNNCAALTKFLIEFVISRTAATS